MSRFLDALSSGQVLLMDGAMGTELQRAGLQPGECGERWNLTHPERVHAIHDRYVKAGAHCLLTNTFQANPRTLSTQGLYNKLDQINRAALDLALDAAGLDVFVLGDVGPIPDLTPGIATLDELADLFRMVPLLGPADGLLLDTQTTPLALMLGQLCRGFFKGAPLPVLVSLTFCKKKGQVVTITGHRPADCAKQAGQFDVAALGVNCGRDIGMEETIEIIRQYRQATDLPLFARPNAGTPTRAGQQWVYPHTPAQMAERLPELLEAGVAMVGGCCGTTPEHIAAFKPIIDAWNARHPPQGPNP
jgi:5-methyltetrahydrofolate--homocysteine methyltransferase